MERAAHNILIEGRSTAGTRAENIIKREAGQGSKVLSQRLFGCQSFGVFVPLLSLFYIMIVEILFGFVFLFKMICG